MKPKKHYWFHGDCICQRVNAVEIYHGTALGNEIISVFIDGVRFVPASEPDAYAQGYEAALRDAVGALRKVDLFSRDYFLAVAAIKALGGER